MQNFSGTFMEVKTRFFSINFTMQQKLALIIAAEMSYIGGRGVRGLIVQSWLSPHDWAGVHNRHRVACLRVVKQTFAW